MIIGICTPISQSNIPRPMCFLLAEAARGLWNGQCRDLFQTIRLLESPPHLDSFANLTMAECLSEALASRDCRLVGEATRGAGILCDSLMRRQFVFRCALCGLMKIAPVTIAPGSPSSKLLPSVSCTENSAVHDKLSDRRKA